MISNAALLVVYYD